MTVPFFALASLIALIPAFGMVSRFQAVGAASAILALALVATALAMPAGSLGRFTRLMQPILIALIAAPALWMVMQILPMPLPALANQIWSSASSALNRPLAGAITIDIGETLLSLAQYSAVAAAALVTAAVALDRQRAESILYILTTVTTLIAARQVVIELGSYDDALAGSAADGEEAIMIAVAGTVLSCAVALHAYDRLRRSAKPQRAGTEMKLTLSAAGVAFIICASAILIRGEIGVVVAALLAIGTLGAIFVIRHWLLGPWGKAGLAAAAIVAVFGAVATIPVKKDTDLAVAWSVQSQTASERMLADVPLAGSGAGAYEGLLPIYRDADLSLRQSPTAAAVIVIEMGRTFFVGVIVAALCSAWLLFGRALARRQDYIFAAAGAAMLAAAPVLVFTSGGMFGPGASLLAGVLGGLAFAQSLSASPRQILSLTLPTAPRKADSVQGGEAPAAPHALGAPWPRFALALLALVLIMQAAWILGAERYAPGERILAHNAASTGAEQERLREAAANAGVRCDLWAESAWVQIAHREADMEAGRISGSAPASALEDLNRAVSCAPHRSDAWLMLALLADRYKPAGYDAAALLKMSYYTAPNDLELLPLRLNVALTADSTAGDAELWDMIRRDIRLVLTRQPRLQPALIAAYRSASPARKLVAERLIAEVDPGYLKTIRAQ